MPNIKIKKDGQEYDIGVMPQHYPADRVYLDGDTTKTVQDEIERGSVSVTADGVKTYQTLLSELFALISFSKVNNNTTLVIDKDIYSISKISSTNYRFGMVNSASASGVAIYSISLVSSSSSCHYTALDCTNNGNTVTSLQTNVATSGIKITLYY